MAIESTGDGQRALDQALEEGQKKADPVEVSEADSRLQELLDKVDAPPSASGEAAASASGQASVVVLPSVSTRTAQPVGIKGRDVSLRVRGLDEPVVAKLEVGVARAVIETAISNGDRVVIEQAPGEAPLVVGVITTRVPEELTLRAKKIHIEGDQEVLIRSGRGAMRVRQDGDVELVGSRISAMSRGLFRLVGRVLRLN
jgi:hypothetical protein